MRGQGQGQPLREQTLSRPRTGMLEVRDQEHRRKCSPKRKNVFKKFFQAIFKRGKQKRSSQIFCEVCGVFQKILAVQKIGSYRGREASSPRPRTSKCILEDSTYANYPEKPMLHSLLNSASQLPSFIASRSTT